MTETISQYKTDKPTSVEQANQNVRKLAEEILNTIGAAEWGAPEHGAEMYSEFIGRFYNPLCANFTYLAKYDPLSDAPAPEPTTEEIFMSSLKDLILEYASQTHGE